MIAARAPGLGEHTSHAANCVCVSCLACRTNTTLETELRVERLRADSVLRLDGHQRHLLERFTKRWNADRAHRGLAPKLAHEALTEGLEALIAMIGQE
jgi:hypothetical protein